MEWIHNWLKLQGARFSYETDDDLYDRDEYYAHPMETVQHLGGDCEDMSIFCAALLQAAVPELDPDEDDEHIRRSEDVTANVHGADRRFVVLVYMIQFREVRDRIRTKVCSELDGIAVKLSKKTFESE